MKESSLLWLVRWYGRYAFSYADLKEVAAERGLKIERSKICRWAHEYRAMLAKLIKPLLKSTDGSWKLDDTYVKIKGFGITCIGLLINLDKL